VAAVRENIGYEMPLSMDHLGHIGVKSVIRLGKAYEKFNLEWIEDVIPWYYTDLLKEITQESPTPTLTGEDIYKVEDFETLCREHVVDKIHPDLATSGGILQTHHIGDMAFKYGVPMAMHFAGTPCKLHGQRSLRRGHAQLPGAGEPFARCALLAGPRHRAGKADHQQGIYQAYPIPQAWEFR
jgi:L-alanine-DL-glutamate epimerase-like enolase superfamily enzyme